MNRSSPHAAEPVTRYLRDLRRALSPLPEADRADILAEIESHIAERALAPGASATDVLARLGSPENLARDYVQHHQVVRALCHASPWPLVAAVLNRATRSVTAFLAGVAGVILYALSLSLALVGVLKPIAPRNVGLWTGPDGLTFGIVASPPPPATEALGVGIVPAALVGAVLCYLLATALMRRCGRRLLRRTTPAALA